MSKSSGCAILLLYICIAAAVICAPSIYVFVVTTLFVPLELGGERAQERIRLQEALRGFSFVKEVKESDANFFLVQASVERCGHMEMGVWFRFGRLVAPPAFPARLLCLYRTRIR